jgi:hypothetical protein
MWGAAATLLHALQGRPPWLGMREADMMVKVRTAVRHCGM